MTASAVNSIYIYIKITTVEQQFEESMYELKRTKRVRKNHSEERGKKTDGDWDGVVREVEKNNQYIWVSENQGEKFRERSGPFV